MHVFAPTYLFDASCRCNGISSATREIGGWLHSSYRNGWLPAGEGVKTSDVGGDEPMKP